MGDRGKRKEDRGQETGNRGQGTRDSVQGTEYKGTRDRGQETGNREQGTRDVIEQNRCNVTKETVKQRPTFSTSILALDDDASIPYTCSLINSSLLARRFSFFLFIICSRLSLRCSAALSILFMKYPSRSSYDSVAFDCKKRLIKTTGQLDGHCVMKMDRKSKTRR